MMPAAELGTLFAHGPRQSGEKGGAMYFQQADLFWGMNKNFVKKVIGSAEKESHPKGHFLFHEGDPATYFYILLKGRIKLTIGEVGQMVHTVDQAGEAFGWSSLIDRDVYTASAECTQDATLQKFDRRTLQKIIEEEPSNGIIFFKRLAETIGYRLLCSYKMISSSSIASSSITSGSEQIEDSEAVA
jgi:CRP-like cAMP-binding protein